ncbi:MAG: PASTA domain-containing protein [Cyclobacteriaceae bacterium]
MKLGRRSYKDLILHLIIMGVVGVGLILFFFFVYLPASTNHGETITVPDLEGATIEELDDYLVKRNLRYEITEDSGYSANYAPLAVLKQFPLANSQVKENRKVYVTLNAKSPPLVRMPRLIDGSVKNTQLVLRTYDLLLGDITYVPDIAANAVLEQFYKGSAIAEGEYVPKGAKIDLEVGDGLGNQIFESPFLIGQNLEDAQFAIIGSGLKVGDVYYQKDGKAELEVEDEDGNITVEEKDIAAGSVFKQRPTAGTKVKLGQSIDLWVVERDTVSALDIIESIQ